MLLYARIVNETDKSCEVGLGDDFSFYESIGMEKTNVEQAYNGLWYIEGYAPQKPNKEIAQEKISELTRRLSTTDYIDNKFIEAIVKNDTVLLDELKVKYKDTLEERQNIRNQIRELEEIANG